LTDDTVRLSMIGQILRGRWRLLTVIAIAGALVGAAASLVLSPGYRTSTSILLQGPREPDELVTETKVATSTVVLDRSARSLGISEAELRDAVTAEVVDGNVIDIVATAPNPDRATQLADRVAQEYVTYYGQLLTSNNGASTQVLQEKREQLRQQVEQANNRINELHTELTRSGAKDTAKVETELESLRGALNEAARALENAGSTSTREGVVVMGAADRPTSQAAPTLPQLAVGGAVAFFLIALFGHLLAARSDRRLREEAEIAAALGAPALGGIDVPDDPADRTARGPLRWLVHNGAPLDLPRLPATTEDQQDVRYQRVLAKLRQSAGRLPTVLVLVAEDDGPAKRAATRLAAADPTRLRVVELAAGSPTVPTDGPLCGVVAVVTSGLRAPWELVGIAEACADSGRPLTGVVVTRRIRLTGAVKARPERDLVGAR
jgi:capsular polysaccharide biosynthesis protein